MPLRMVVCRPAGDSAEALVPFLRAQAGFEILASCRPESAPAVVARATPGLVVAVLDRAGASVGAIESIMAATPVPILALGDGDGARAAAALGAGALEVTPLRALRLDRPGDPASRVVCDRMRLLGRTPVIRHPRARLPRPAQGRPRPRGAVIGIVASTGGPQALAAVLRTLPADFPLPILIVQHMTAGFLPGMVEWLDGIAALPVRLATGPSLMGGGAWVAPDGAHLALGPDRCLHRPDGAGPYRPSGDVLLTSLARRLGAAAVAVVLTGMGHDGAAGLAAVRQAGGLTIAQDAGSAAVAGMPRAAAAAGAEHVLTPQGIGARLGALAGTPA